MSKYPLTLFSYYAMYVPVYPGRGLGHDGDHRWGGCGACGLSETNAWYSGAEGKALGHYDPMRLKWLNNPGGKPQTPCDPGLCKIFPEAKTAAKAWAREIASQPDHHDRHFCESLRPRNPSLLTAFGNGITVSTKGGAMPSTCRHSGESRSPHDVKGIPACAGMTNRVELIET